MFFNHHKNKKKIKKKMEKAILIMFLVATSMTYYQTLAQEEESNPYPEAFADPPKEFAGSPIAAAYDHELISHMTKQQLQFLQDCSDKLSMKCSMEMSKRLDDDKPVSVECCKDILMMGKDCHEVLDNFEFSTYELKDTANELLPRSKMIWNQCVKTTAARIGAPMYFET